MSFVQRLIYRILPERWAADIERASRNWMLQCPCGHEISVWEAGGIRYKAAGNPRQLMRCTQCGRLSWHRIYKKDSRTI